MDLLSAQTCGSETICSYSCDGTSHKSGFESIKLLLFTSDPRNWASHFSWISFLCGKSYFFPQVHFVFMQLSKLWLIEKWILPSSPITICCISYFFNPPPVCAKLEIVKLHKYLNYSSEKKMRRGKRVVLWIKVSLSGTFWKIWVQDEVSEL